MKKSLILHFSVRLKIKSNHVLFFFLQFSPELLEVGRFEPAPGSGSVNPAVPTLRRRPDQSRAMHLFYFSRTVLISIYILKPKHIHKLVGKLRLMQWDSNILSELKKYNFYTLCVFKTQYVRMDRPVSAVQCSTVQYIAVQREKANDWLWLLNAIYTFILRMFRYKAFL